MTLTGIVLIPLSLVLIALPWRFSLYAFLPFAMLSDAAVINIGAFPLSPTVFYGLLMMSRFALERGFKMVPPQMQVVRQVMPIALLFWLNLIILFLAIVFFYGEVDVVTGEMAFNYYLAQPFAMVRENFTQIAYLFYHTLLVIALADIAGRLPASEVGAVIDRAIMGALFFSALVIGWELSSFYAGVWFAEDFFHSDTHSDAWGQLTFGGTVLRASGPFSEPSGVGFTFGGFLLYAWRRYRTAYGAPMVSVAAILACLASMAMSTATTAYAAMALFALVALVDVLTGFGREEAAAMHMPRWPAYVLLIGGGFAFFLLLRANWNDVLDIFTTATVEKGESSSFRERSMVDVIGLRILVETYGLGLGLGSHKPNSALVTLLSNVGLPGFLLVVYFFGKRLLPLPRTVRAQLSEFSAVHAALRVMLLGWLFGHAFSNPNLNHVGIWAASALLIGLGCAIARSRAAPIGKASIEIRTLSGRRRSTFRAAA